MADFSLQADSACANHFALRPHYGLDELASEIEDAANIAYGLSQDGDLQPYQASALRGLEVLLDSLGAKANALDAIARAERVSVRGDASISEAKGGARNGR